MVAVRPTFHSPALLAKQAANIDHICGTPGRLSLNVVSSWWADEARQYGVHFEQHEDRYARTAEWLEVVDGLWKQDRFSFRRELLPRGEHDPGTEAAQPSAPGALRRRRKRGRQGSDCAALRRLRHARGPARARSGKKSPTFRRGGNGSNSRRCSSAWRPTRSSATPSARAQAELARITDVKATAAGFANYQQWLSGTQLEQRMTIEEYSVSNRGLRPGLVRYARTGGGAGGRVRGRWRRSPAAAMQSAGRGEWSGSPPRSSSANAKIDWPSKDPATRCPGPRI